MAKLEHTHSTTSQTMVSERNFMYDMNKIKDKKKLVNEYLLQQNNLDELKLRQKNTKKLVEDKDVVLDELYLGLRKLKISEKCDCLYTDIIEKNFFLSSDQLLKIAGRNSTSSNYGVSGSVTGGVNSTNGIHIKSIENDYNILIVIKEKNGVSTMRITGVRESILLGYECILAKISTVSIDAKVSDEKLACLLLQKGKLVMDLELKYDVKIDINKIKNECKILGQNENINLTINEINSIESSRIEILVEFSVLAHIVGCGGSIIKSILDGNKVQIDVNRESKSIIIVGFLEDVQRVTVLINEIIDENSQVVDTIEGDKVRNLVFRCVQYWLMYCRIIYFLF